MEYKDYYKILGIDKSASQDDIKKAYRRLARKYHPDVSTEKDAEDHFKEIKEAYEVLGDPEKRQKYDTLGSNWQAGDQFDPRGQGFGGAGDFSGFTSQTFTDADFDDFSDFFAEIFGGGRRRSGGGNPFGGGFGEQFQQRQQPQRGQDVETKLTIGLQEALKGTERSLRLRTASGEKNLSVKIPAGIKEGQKIRLSGQGNPGQQGGPKGDLFVKVSIQVPQGYEIKEGNIFQDVAITPWEAALGDKINVHTLHGQINVKVPAGSQSGKTLRLKNKGMPISKSKKGDYFLVLQIYVPQPQTEEDKQFYRDMADKMAFNPRETT